MTMTFETQDLKDACEAHPLILGKLTEIKDRAPVYGTPGPTALHADAKHAHIGSKTGVAWYYHGDKGCHQHILALGKKNDNAGSGTSQYDWSKKGDVPIY